ncbi:MAG: hypothetical protein V7L22_30180 [Nostoc sp.]|uniref:hypothetical protein n=1 Tax=Nostoc sp. TaxID=1180 RepID=UPI002FF772DA
MAHSRTLIRWAEHGYFTPNSLLYKFARRLAELEELAHPDVTEQEITLFIFLSRFTSSSVSSLKLLLLA